MIHFLRTDITIQRPLESVFEFFGDAANLQAITPPELDFHIVTPMPIDMRVGTEIEYRIRLLGVPFSWLTRISAWEPGMRFVDEQRSGPFRTWVHEHRFERVSESTTRIRDVVRYSLPFEPLGRVAHPFVRARLNRIFDYREIRVRELLEAARSPHGPSTPARRAAVSQSHRIRASEREDDRREEARSIA